MSSILTKTIVSVFMAASMEKSTCKYNPTTFICTYGAMVVYDTYCFLKGDIKTFNTLVGGKITDKKEYRISEIDWVKYVANLLPLGCCIIDDAFPLGVAITVETVADALNWHPTTTLVYEINS